MYTSKRYSISKALAELLSCELDGTKYTANVYGNVHPRLLFWDEVTSYPAIHLSIGPESRVYQGGGYKDRFLTITIRIYVKEEDAQEALEVLLESVETIIDKNGRLAYQTSLGATQYTHDINIMSIITDEGALEPLGVAEIALQVRY